MTPPENPPRLEIVNRDGSPIAPVESLSGQSAIATIAGQPLHPNRGTSLNLDWVESVRVNTSAVERRAATLVNGRRMAMVKAARRREHLLFDVPVVGLATIPVLKETNTTVLAVEAGRTLMLDKLPMLEAANAAGIAIIGHE